MSKNERRRRKVRRNKFLIKLMLLAMELLVLYFVLRRSTVFRVKVIDVSGNERISRERILELSGVTYGENLLRLSKKNIETHIKKEPYIDTVHVKKKLLNRLLVEVAEKKPVAYFAVENSKVLVDAELSFLEVADVEDDVPEGIECDGFLETIPRDDDSLKKELAVHVKNDFFRPLFNSTLFSKIERLEALDQNIQIYCKGATKVIFGDAYDADYKINVLSDIFRDLEAKQTHAKQIDMTQKFPVVMTEEGEEDESE